MAVAFDASSESHTGTTGSVSEASFSWTHTPVGTPKGVLVYTFSNANNSTADVARAVRYGDKWVARAVASGRAVDTAGEPGDCKAWLIGPTNAGGADGTWMTTSTLVAAVWTAYGDGKWVLVQSGGVQTTSDPYSGSWTSNTSGLTTTLSCAEYGNGYWVAVGSSGLMRYTTDPTGTWSTPTNPGFSTTQINRVAYGNGYWVAVGASGKIRCATDPTGTWSEPSSPGFSTNNVEAVAYGNGYWVAVGANGSIRYATDPTGTWSAPSSPGFGNTSLISAVGYGNGYWIAANNESLASAIRYTTNPTGTWSAPTSLGGLLSARSPRSFAYGDGQWILTFNTGIVRYTTDPTGTWINGITSDTGVAYPAGATNTGYPSVAWDADNNIFLMAHNTAATNPAPRVSSRQYNALPSSAQTVTVYRTNTTDEMYAVAITVTADCGVEAAGVSAVSADASGGTVALAGTSISDGSPGTKSMRFAGVNSGLSDVPTANSGTTNIQSIDYGTRVIAVARETSASEGSTSIGWTAAADDVAAVYLAIREAIVPWTVGVPIR